MNKTIAASVVAGLLAGGAAGVALGVPALSGAQESPTTTTAPADPAAPDTIAPSDATPAPADDTAERTPNQWLTDALAPLVADGTITQAQADAVASAIAAARPEHGPFGRGVRFGVRLETVATAIGISADDLRTALQDGQSIAEVAQANSVDPQTVIDALVAEVKAHLDEEVAAGEHTQEEADAKLATATERITAMVNGELPAGGPGFGGPHGRGFGPGFGPGAPDDTDGTDSTDSTDSSGTSTSA